MSDSAHSSEPRNQPSSSATKPRALWLAWGLGGNAGGIGRFCLALAAQLAARDILNPSELQVVVDGNPAWVGGFFELGASIRTRERARRFSAGFSVESAPRIVHNFGPGTFPTRRTNGDEFRVMSIYDWGPFRDRDMRMSARIKWCHAIVRGAKNADLIHYLNPYLPGTRPRLVPTPKRELVSYGASALAALPPEWSLPPAELPEYGIFIGTNAPRKRIPAIVEMCRSTGSTESNVVLVGTGTEKYRGCQNVRAMGRIADSTLEDILDHSSAVILVSSYEGFGIPIMEAAVRGIFSVVSPEVFSTLPADLKDWVVVTDPFSPDDFAEAVRTASGRRGSARYDGSRLIAPLLDIYSELLVQ